MTFDIKSGAVHLSDPCYEPGTWCGAWSVPAKNGTWEVEVGFHESEKRIAFFSAWHKDHEGEIWQDLDFEFGVDSGQFGIFDAEIYNAPNERNSTSFYDECCEITIDHPRYGAIWDRGFVSSSGWGDGGYYGSVAYDEDGNLVKFEIVFIEEEE